ncbi:MAG: radical SAM-associated putative lipoprotein [Prevotellaceae bacterium]|jgi:putative lipoprotein (rSAM/lipoprotein system)|nr:radical SAM-associated putative lipoprotein [Prevotellaceae bacterium]
MKHLIKTSNSIIAALLALLGFSVSSCEEPRTEYGSPSVDFVVKGKVTSQETKEPINKIAVLVSETAWDNDTVFYQMDSVTTDANGNYYSKRTITSFADEHNYKIHFKDIDGEENGLFNDSTVIVSTVKEDYKGGNNHWYGGEATKELNIELVPKQ